MESRVRPRTIVPAIAVALILALTLVFALTQRAGEADNIPNEYSMSLDIPLNDVPLSTPFTVQAGIGFSGGGVCDGSPGIFGCYQAAQWVLTYDATRINAGATCSGAVNCTQITRVSGAPTVCTSEAVDTSTSLIQLGCLSRIGEATSAQRRRVQHQRAVHGRRSGGIHADHGYITRDIRERRVGEPADPRTPRHHFLRHAASDRYADQHTNGATISDGDTHTDPHEHADEHTDEHSFTNADHSGAA